MTEPTTPHRPAGWEGAQWRDEKPAEPAPRASTGAFERFIGGSPGVVLLRLVVVSVAVGALLLWLDVRPYEVFQLIQNLAHRLSRMGFAAVREVLDYVLAGAVLVLPVWLIVRVFKMRR